MFTEKNTTYQYPRAILSVDLSGESMCNYVMLKTSLKILKCGTEITTYFIKGLCEQGTPFQKFFHKLIRKSQH